MAAPSKFITPPNRVERWRKLWATPKKLTLEETEAAFDEFMDGCVRRHMRKMFLKQFGHPKAQYGVRFFLEDITRYNWNTRLGLVLGEGEHIEATVIYGTPDALEAYRLRGERRRSLKDIVIDDWHSACAIIKSPTKTIYLFVEEKMNGCLLRTDQDEDAVADDEASGHFIEHDYDPNAPKR